MGCGCKFLEPHSMLRMCNMLLVQEHTVDITHLAGISSLEVLKVCVNAEKKMSTIRMALKIPITIATLIMLVRFFFS